MIAVRCSLTASIILSPLLFAASALAEEKAGPASDGQPGIHRVALPEAAAPNVDGTFGYGLTEAQSAAPGVHQRLSLRVGGAVAILPWLNVAPALDGRWDVHSNDSGRMLGGRLAARAFTGWHNLKLGAELTGWVAGAEQFSTVAHSASLDARALAAVRFAHSFIAFNAGYRFDRSAAAGANAPWFSPSDRMALGLSDFDAVLLGVGGGLDLVATELFAEATSDWLVGSGAPPFSQSPLRLAAGARRAFSDALTAQLVLEGLLSARPASEPSAPLAPIEPRASLFVGASYRFGAQRVAATPKAAPPAKPPQAVTPLQPAVSALELTIVDDTGAPVPGARAHVSIGAYEYDLELDATGRQRKDELPVGAAKIAVSAPGFAPGERALELTAGAPTELRIELKALPPSSQVRGMVRSFGGAGLAAKIRVDPLGIEGATGEDGRFEIDVPPGSYEVLIEANGYHSQRRKLSVDPEGVVILNAELGKKK